MKRSLLVVLFSMCVILPLMAESALEFDGLNDHVQLSSVLNIGNGSNTVEAWVKIPVINSGNLISGERVGVLLGNYQDSPNVNWEIYSSGQLRFYWNAGEWNLLGSKDLRDNAWHHIAFIRDVSADSVFLYVDGVLDVSQVDAGTNITLASSFYIGSDRRGSGVPYFHGIIDELRIWTTARTQDQLREYMCEDVSAQSGLVSYYKMSNGSGITLTDNTGNGNTGTLVNMDNSDWVRDNLTPAGDGSTTPYQINGLNQLYWLSQNSELWSADHEQISDIMATATDSWDGGAGFTPIGNSSIKFNGTYDGNDLLISDLTINRPTTDKVAFIGWTNTGTLISNVHLTNVDITGDGSSGSVVGYLMSGDVNQCSSSGSVSGVNYVGGLVGQMANGSISECFSTVTVAGSGQYAGGLNGLFGGGTLSNCYASGDVSGVTYVGGLIGSAFGGTSTTNSYSTGSVSGTSNVGGLIGHAAPEDEFFGDPGAEITACFWDTEASGNASSAAGTGKTTAEMKTLSTYTDAGWDFAEETVNGTDNYWGINNSEHDGYPFQSWEDFTHNYSDTPLPVTLVSFDAVHDQGVINMTWSTESETQNLGFMLERKIGDSDWKMIANYLNDLELTGHGTTSETHDYVFTDSDVIAGQTYEYRISDISESNEINELMSLSINIEPSNELTPMTFGISKTYPNPFNPVLSIRYDLYEAAPTTIKILNLTGQTVAILDDEFRNAGNYELQWQAENVASGIYFVKIISGVKSDMRKVMLLK
ncbi:MAG: T9SS type A sorting domain-containing protein [Candidatus Marinimicrobia bacterium]|nr:T9SS type A sorting domain-containing protein [Candidatus Neomarinimicrobiota bacterium]